MMENKELPFIQEMFDRIAPKYDFLNRALSLNRDVYWRKTAIAALRLNNKKISKLLDVACGTGDMALEAVRQLEDQVDIIGVDFSYQMLVIGAEKIRRKGVKNIRLAFGNALYLPICNESFDAVSIAFGIRNIADRKSALQEFFRVLKPGGRLAILELSTPETSFFKAVYLFYFQKLLPLIGGLFSKNRSAYEYLPESVLRFPPAGQFCEVIREAGFADVRARKLTLGIVTLYIGQKDTE